MLQITASGTPRNVGFEYGRAARDLIRASYLARMRRAARVTAEQEVLTRALTYRPYVERYAPELLDEVAGVAAGAGIDFDAAFFLQVATELELAAEAESSGLDGCSSLGGTDAAAGAFVAQNWDQPPGTSGTQILLRLAPRGGPRLVMFARAGVVGYIGLNEAGVGLVSNQLYASSPPGLTGYFIMRRFLGCGSIEEALEWLDSVEIGSSGNYLLGDPRGRLVDVELGGGGHSHVAGASQVHTNHFVTERGRVLDQAGSRMPDSVARYKRLGRLFGEKSGVRDAIDALRDHEGYPLSVCRHEGEGGLDTVASIIVLLERRELLVCEGHPCRGTFRSYALLASG
jgi:isopenicillin-N N-acyltransferase-like protein